MIKDFESPYDGRHEGAARLGQDRHFTGSVSQYHGGCGLLSSSGSLSRPVGGPGWLGRWPSSCAERVHVFRLQTSSCSVGGGIRPERPTMTTMSGPAW